MKMDVCLTGMVINIIHKAHCKSWYPLFKNVFLLFASLYFFFFFYTFSCSTSSSFHDVKEEDRPHDQMRRMAEHKTSWRAMVTCVLVHWVSKPWHNLTAYSKEIKLVHLEIIESAGEPWCLSTQRRKWSVQKN